MQPRELRRVRQSLGMTQDQLGKVLKTTRMTITRYENGKRKIPGMIEVLINQLASTTRIPMSGIVAAGEPIEPIPQTELVEVPSSMMRPGANFALRVKGESMRDEGILPGDIVIVHKQLTARNGQTIIALINKEATIKKFMKRGRGIELHPANATMKPIQVKSTDDFTIEGVVIGLIRQCQ